VPLALVSPAGSRSSGSTLSLSDSGRDGVLERPRPGRYVEEPQPEKFMLRSLALSSIAVSAFALTTSGLDTHAKPCNGLTAVPALEEMLPRARAALDIPGTEQVAVDPTRRCIGIPVRTQGTARLVKLLLRGVEIPREAVDLRVVEPVPAPGA
jgi:hypothetical protein